MSAKKAMTAKKIRRSERLDDSVRISNESPSLNDYSYNTVPLTEFERNVNIPGISNQLNIAVSMLNIILAHIDMLEDAERDVQPQLTRIRNMLSTSISELYTYFNGNRRNRTLQEWPSVLLKTVEKIRGIKRWIMSLNADSKQLQNIDFHLLMMINTLNNTLNFMPIYKRGEKRKRGTLDSIDFCEDYSNFDV